MPFIEVDSWISLGPSSESGSLSVVGNPFLTSLSGLESLQSVSAGLTITTNGALTSLSGLESLQSSGGLSITNNRVLPNCLAIALRDRIGLGNIGGPIRISDNSPDCP